MAQLVDATPILPRASTGAPDVRALALYDARLNQALFQTFIKFAYRLNSALMRDGSEPMSGPLVLPTYTVAGVPDVATYARGLIYVSNETGGATIAFSDGVNWRRVQDRAIVS